MAEQYAGTDTGLQRRANEDALLARAPLFVVADGMGGAQAGEVASKVAVEFFHAGLPDGDGDGAGAERALAAHAHAANARIHTLSRENAEQAGMGTTLTAVYVGEREVAIAHVGDSRAYCLRDGELLRLTDDHSLVDELIREGRLTPEEAEEHPQRSIITRALGPEETVEVDTRSFRARAGDIYLLCSDGLTSMVPEARLAELLRTHADAPLRDTGELLIAEANRAGGRDNITVILLRLEEVGSDAPPAPAPGRAATGDEHTTLVGVPAAAPPQPRAALAGVAEEHRTAAGVPARTRAALQTQPLAVRQPRAPMPAAANGRPGGARARRRRRVLGALVALALLGLIVAGGYVAMQSVYFVGTNARGLVTMYRGLPYQLPGGIRLYSSYYVSGVSAATLSPGRRSAVLDHKWRSEKEAGALVRSVELEELAQ
ncbi:MAG TPA: Stp1/IreP family PP2C-type Ser/Thr phosphatase [Solirubrobacteraceae bacterium]|nr:Stp1/IreP family PP2C-type Ser/Thr phosphatase [Solirubrobacteraceae bacterium]